MDTFKQTGKRGRPQIILNYPKAGRFTVNDLELLNPHVECRLSVYTHAKKLVSKGEIRYTGKTIPLNGPGKPLDEFESMANYRRVRSFKRNTKLRKLANVSVDLTPASVPAVA